MAYLQTMQAVKDYSDTLSAAGFTTQSFDANYFKDLWHDKVAEMEPEMAQAVNENDVLPEKIVDKIEANVRQSIVLSKFTPTYNVTAGKIFIDNSTDTALGHVKLATKTEQTGILTPRPFLPESIYKLQSLDYMTYLHGGALVQWVLEELPKHVVRTMEIAILVGGIKNEDGSDFTAIYPIMNDTLTKAISATDIFSGLIDGIAAVDGDSSNKFVFINPADYATLLKTGDNLAIALLIGTVNLGATIVPTDIIPANAAKPTFLVVNTDQFVLGMMGSGIQTLSQFVIGKNGQTLESAVWVAGSLNKANAAAKVTVTTAA